MSDEAEVLGVHTGAVDAVVATGDRVITAGRDGRILSWPVAGGEGTVLHALDPDAWAKPVAMTELPGAVLVAFSDGTLLRVSLDGGAEPVPIPTFEDGLIDVAMLGEQIVVAGDSNRVEVLGADGSATWRGETYKWPYALAVSPSGKRLLAVTWDGYAYVVATDPFPAMEHESYRDERYTELPYPVHPAGVSPIFDGVWLDEDRVALAGCALGDEGGAARIWRPGTKDWEPGAFDADEGIHAAALSPDGKTLAVGGNDQAVTLLSTKDLAVLRRWALGTPSPQPDMDRDTEFIHRLKRRGITYTGGPDPSPDVDWSSDAYYPVAVEFYSGTGAAAVFDLAWSPDGTRLYMGTQSGGVLALGVD